ncbi:MAG TPA: hypothetical protein VJM31_18985 [Vicinamibacterales bacterium]|nr:hypothetical protein [Vicinamibacterales bacterium]
MASTLKCLLKRALIGTAVVAVVTAAGYSALGPPESKPSRTLGADYTREDKTSETGADEARVVQMQEIDHLAAKKLGPAPEAKPANTLVALSKDTGGTDLLQQVRAARELRKKQGSAAAAEALKVQPASTTNP